MISRAVVTQKAAVFFDGISGSMASPAPRLSGGPRLNLSLGDIFSDPIPYFTGPFFISITGSIRTLNWNTGRTSIQVCARYQDQFPTEDLNLLLGGNRFQHSPAYPGHCSLEHGSNKLWVGRERFLGGRQHPDDRLIEPGSHLLRDPRSVHVGAYRVESDTRLRVPHFGLKKCGNESSRHFSEGFTLLFLANKFDGLGDRDKMTLQGSL